MSLLEEQRKISSMSLECRQAIMSLLYEGLIQQRQIAGDTIKVGTEHCGALYRGQSCGLYCGQAALCTEARAAACTATSAALCADLKTPITFALPSLLSECTGQGCSQRGAGPPDFSLAPPDGFNPDQNRGPAI
jgi:hypothetical protein